MTRALSGSLMLLMLLACGGTESTTDQPAAAVDGDEDTSVAAAPAPAAPTPSPAKVPVAPVVDTGDIAAPNSLVRESFSYSFTRSSRDPFKGLAVAAAEGPELTDLRLLSVIYNHSEPTLSLATFEDVGNKKQFYVRPGDRIGRLTVSSIDLNNATLRSNDYGTVRQQTYSLTRGEDGNP